MDTTTNKWKIDKKWDNYIVSISPLITYFQLKLITLKKPGWCLPLNKCWSQRHQRWDEQKTLPLDMIHLFCSIPAKNA